ncbi:4'-phosphopantetheinyl transferase family protein [Streptomyces eurythermus]|uniref:4'-phosphopantetheinyl transferase P6 n=1 Tax=Streptomyces antibioticus TaxID=1890 RepID=A0A2K8GNU9_STRAT|nr:4'-phosphopantetheinyl transferase P6 [Streptomyces antibioticus]
MPRTPPAADAPGRGAARPVGRGRSPSVRDGTARFGRGNAVHVWHGRAGDLPDPADLAVLDDTELSTFRRRGAPFAARYAGAHAAVRRILADHYLGGPPAAIRFGRHPCPRCGDPLHGRPRIVAPATRLDFSLSHSGPYWLLAVTAAGQVGVDIEQHTGRGFGDAPRIALSDGELGVLGRAGSEREYEEVFLRAWTRKEAVLKAVGVGIVADLRRLDALTGAHGPVRVDHKEPGSPGGWTVEDLILGPGRSAALAREYARPGPLVLRPTTPPTP